MNDRVKITLKRTICTVPEWVFPKVYINAGETVNCEPANNLPGHDGKMWIVDARVDNDGYGCYVDRSEYDWA